MHTSYTCICTYVYDEQASVWHMSDSLIKNQIAELTTVTDVKQKNLQVKYANAGVMHLTCPESQKW